MPVGAADSAEYINCGVTGKQVHMTVIQCNRYVDSSVPSKQDMYDIAWILETSKNRRAIGFISPQEWAEKQRNGPSALPSR